MYIAKRMKMFNTTVYYDIYFLEKRLTVMNKHIYELYTIFQRDFNYRLSQFEFYIIKRNNSYKMIIWSIIKSHETYKGTWF